MSTPIAGEFNTVPPTFGSGQKVNVQTDPTGRLLVLSGGIAYETVAAGQSAQILGATGAVGDYLTGIVIVPATTSPGAVSITDGNGSAITIFTGGASSVLTLHSWFVPILSKCVNATTPGWKVTTGTNVSVIGIGTFT